MTKFATPRIDSSRCCRNRRIRWVDLPRLAGGRNGRHYFSIWICSATLDGARDGYRVRERRLGASTFKDDGAAVVLFADPSAAVDSWTRPRSLPAMDGPSCRRRMAGDRRRYGVRKKGTGIFFV